MTELLFLHSARRLMLVDTCIKFRKDKDKDKEALFNDAYNVTDNISS